MISNKPNLVKLIMNDFVKVKYPKGHKETSCLEVYESGRRKVIYCTIDDTIQAEMIFGDNPEEVGFMFLYDPKFKRYSNRK